MAVELIMRSSRDEFIDYVRNAEEYDAWCAIADAGIAIARIRMSDANRAELNRTLDQAMAAYEQKFGPWAPF